MNLPNVFANKIDRDIKNNVDYFYGDRNRKVKDLKELKMLFDNKGYINRLPVEITLKDGSKRIEKLVLLKSNGFININNDLILFEDIVDYDIKK